MERILVVDDEPEIADLIELYLRNDNCDVCKCYTAEEALKSTELFVPVEYDDIIDIDDNISVRFNDAGHMLRICNYRNLGN